MPHVTATPSLPAARGNPLRAHYENERTRTALIIRSPHRPTQAELARFAKEDLSNPLPAVFETAGVPPPWESPTAAAAAPGAAAKARGSSAGSRGLEMGEPLLDEPDESNYDKGGAGLRGRVNY